MATEVKIPKISEGVEIATVTEVLISEGDEVEKEQSLITVESDKASVEIPSTHNGKVKSIKVSEDDKVNVGDVILTLEESDVEEEEQGDGEGEKEDKGGPAADEKEEKKEETEERGERKEDNDKKDQEAEDGEDKEEEDDADKTEEPSEDKAESENETKEGSADKGNVPASPGVRRLARELGVDIGKVERRGDHGRISKEAVKAYAKDVKKNSSSAPSDLPDFSQWGETKRKSLPGIRMTTAQKVSDAWQNIPHVFQFEKADMTELEDYLDSKQAEKGDVKITITAVLTKLVAVAVRKFPKFNASLDLENKEMILKEYINIGIAVDTDNGLLMPVLKDVDKKGLIDLAQEIAEMAEKARNQNLKTKEMQGGNFSISNLGGIGGTNFTPIIYHPQAAILGVSRAEIQPVYTGVEFEPRKILPLSLSYDHRLIDGAEAARFITWLKNALEDPFEALLS